MGNQFKIFSDFDGTIALNDVGDQLFDTFADGAWKKAVEDWKQGHVSARECLIIECSLTRVTRQQLEEYSDRQMIDPHFKIFVDYCQKQQYPITILSDGLDFYIERILKNHNLGFLKYYANQLVFDGEDRIYPLFPYYQQGCRICGNCKGYHIRKSRSEEDEIIYIGDGYSDRCGVTEADIVFAKNDLKKYCDENQIKYFEFRDFEDILRTLKEMEGGN